MDQHNISPREMGAGAGLLRAHEGRGEDEDGDTTPDHEMTDEAAEEEEAAAAERGGVACEHAGTISDLDYTAADHHAALDELMREEDAQRRERAGTELRRLAALQWPPSSVEHPVKRRRHSRALASERAFRAKALAHPALALARRTVPAAFACSACRAPLLRPCDVRRGEDVELPVALGDSAETLCAASGASGVRGVGLAWEADTAPEEEAGDDGFYLEEPLIWAVRCQHVACGGCGLVCGVRVLGLRRRHPHELGAALLRLQQRYTRSVASTGFGPPLPHSAARAAMEAAEGRRERYDETAVGLDFLGVRLLRLLRAPRGGGQRGGAPAMGGGRGAGTAHGEVAAAVHEDDEPLELRCAGCMQPLAASDQVLCTARCWSLTGGNAAPPESSCFVNSLLAGSYELRNARPVALSQGRFEMADAFCSGCGAVVGYGFVRDLSASQENFNQVGRFGLVSRCIAWGLDLTDDLPGWGARSESEEEGGGWEVQGGGEGGGEGGGGGGGGGAWAAGGGEDDDSSMAGGGAGRAGALPPSHLLMMAPAPPPPPPPPGLRSPAELGLGLSAPAELPEQPDLEVADHEQQGDHEAVDA
jgi:hypothetical protein